ncbi:hypothetical protein KP509_35G029800 [Ceratopteris richardii]|uniref:non-specific serine/threonine protein kinase n=1 Tax=Ceratopteris richardii TaxID=49495 RepID=A0A8T2QFN0_CERRI|nr:hypothetical protein KP509_35G029800 [Ceratopteris richardii]
MATGRALTLSFSALVCFSFSLLLLLSSFQLLAQPSISQKLSADAASLLAFKASIADPLNRLSSWSAPSSSSALNSSSWFGVSFSVSLSVISITLRSCNLSGSIPPVLGNLSSLQRLDLADNNFTGAIPAEIYGLPSLVSLNLSYNWLSGTILPTFQRIDRLQELDLNTNCLTGTIPGDIANITELRKLDLGGNSFEGALPAQLGTLTNLNYFVAAGNSLTGEIPPSLGNLTKLQWLYLGWNQLTGTIPSSLGRLQSLTLLDFSHNFLSGSIPAELGSLSSLTELRLYNNILTGPIPRELGNLERLKDLDMAVNKLSGEIPLEIGNLIDLELLHLNLNNLSGTFPQWLANMSNLYSLYLFSNFLTGEMPSSMGLNNPRLQLMDVSSNNISGFIPPNLCARSSLEVLIAFSNQLSGPLPASLFDCPSLVRLRLENNLLNGSLPKISASRFSLTYLRISHNSFTGSIPLEIGNITSLQAVIISDNQFEGYLPEELLRLQRLQVFVAAQNKFIGGFPLQVCAGKPKLYLMDIGSNGFEGEITPAISSCTGLINLVLNDNHFSGGIPDELGSLPSLGYLDLSHNELNGPVPASLSSSASLVSINISFNRLLGPIPAGGVFKNLTQSQYEGNPGLCGDIPGLQSCSDDLFSDKISSSHGRDVIHRAPMISYLLPIFCFILALMLLLSALFTFDKCRRHRHTMERQATYGNPSSWKITMFQTSTFPTSEEIWLALKEENVIGQGGSGKVYKGQTFSGEPFVVKKLYARYLDDMESGSLRRSESCTDHGYNAELETLGRIRHRNIVRLLCSCATREHDLLVYEYMANGSLADVLHDKSRPGLLCWGARYRIAMEAAQALCYLHHDCIPQILHRDIKSTNILLDEHFTVRLSDFGVARSSNHVTSSETMSVIAGSCGYIAPEYAYTLKASDKCDVYSFGVVLLELISGKMPVETGLDGQNESLVAWMNKKMIQTAEDMIYVADVNLGQLQQDAKEEAFWVLKVALKCTSPSSYCRPSMKEVVEMLRPKTANRSFSVSSTSFKDRNDDASSKSEYFRSFAQRSYTVQW